MVFIPTEELGVGKWSGTPEDNAHMVENAARLYGADLVTITELDERLFYGHTGSKIIEFKNADEYEDTDASTVIPTQYRYVISLSCRWAMPILNTRVSPLGDTSGRNSIEMLYAKVKPQLAEFIRYLGYRALPAVPALDVPLGVAGGMHELTRTNRAISPEIGPGYYMTSMLTDIPMAADEPIDIGVKEFCQTCKKCAENCPAGVLSFEDEPYWEVKGEWNNPGHRAWFENSKLCMTYWLETNTLCAVCFRDCPFSKYNMASAHELVKAITANTTIFNGFFKAMDDFMGYGGEWDAEEIWAKRWSPHGWNIE
jgi:reductive dehalogenase